MRSDVFRAATARQIAREFAGLDPGPGLDAAPALPRSPLPLLRADEINWAIAPAETIPSERGNLRASTIAYRELAQAGCHGLHLIRHQHDRLLLQHHRLRDEVRALRASLSDSDSEPSLPESESENRMAIRVQPRLPLSGVRGVQGVRGL